MNVVQKSDAIKAGLRKGFQDGSSKVAKRKCYGYTLSPNGELEINPREAKVVCWIFERYLSGDSLGRIATGLEKQCKQLPAGKEASHMLQLGASCCGRREIYSDMA